MDVGRKSFEKNTYILLFFNHGVSNNGIVNQKGPNKQ